ncbi:Cytochrome B561-related [Dillenia turbinata]|uniref:Cytochrome B561-related n=1 Tax=Dillenia turbinata TaxID=194707 RepID=A0AAN8Z529_9MAGN
MDRNSSPPSKPSKFAAYQNPTFSAALTATSLRPSTTTLLLILSLSSASALSLLSFLSRENGFIDDLKRRNFGEGSAHFLAKAIEAIVGLFFVGTLSALMKAIALWKSTDAAGVPIVSKGSKDQKELSNRQLGLLGIKPKAEAVSPDPSKKPLRPKSYPSSTSDALIPLHQPIPASSRSSRTGIDKPNVGGANRISSFSTPTKSPGSATSPYLVPMAPSPVPSVRTSPGSEQSIMSPWSNKGASSGRKIVTEEMLEEFLADVDEKITQSAGKSMTPPPTINGFGIASPTSAKTSGTRSTPLRPVRMSPGSQKFKTPPKKGEGDLPPPMSMEESIEAFEHLGIYPQIEQWRDNLRQWFSSVLLNPLLKKIETSHSQVMQTASKLGISIKINQIGSQLPSTGAPAGVSSIDRTKDWQPAFNLDEDGLHQLRTTLVQALDSLMPKFPASNLQQSPQQNLVPLIQACVDAITEHQRLYALVKGELIKGLLPQSSVRAEYIAQRIRELAEGTCVKNYEYPGNAEVYDKVNNKWTVELPTDSHLLIYLFCAFLEYPKWMLHVDPTSYAGSQSSKNPLFLGVLPPKERFPEKYVAVISGVPSILHPGACILVAGKQSPPIFALYWDKKTQFALQGRTALWDSILLLCYKIKLGYGGIVRGMHLGSSALNLLPVLNSETEE